MQERLQKILANAGICSRRKAEEYILKGRVTIDGKTVTEMGVKVDPNDCTITVDNKPIKISKKKVYLLF